MREALLQRGHRVSILAGILAPDCEQTPAYAVPELHGFARIVRRIRASIFGEQFEVFQYWRSILRGLRDIHARDRVDVFEIEDSFGWGARVQSSTEIPVVVRLHGPAAFTTVGAEKHLARNRRKILAEGSQLEHARIVVAPCASTLTSLRQHYRLPVKQARLVANPLIMDAAVPTWRADSCDRNTILYVGRFDYAKGADLALTAFEQIMNAKPSAKLLFVGADDGVDVERGGRLKFHEYCSAMLKPSTVAAIEFFGSQSRSRIEELRLRAGVTIMSSRWENQPYALMEAMWQGCPIVANRVGGIPEMIDHGTTGLLADASDAVEFADAISLLLQDTRMAEGLGAAARRAVHVHHSAATICDAALEAYGSAILSPVCGTRNRGKSNSSHDITDQTKS